MIYLVLNKSNNTCKIGYSENPDKRLKQLQTANSHPLELLKTIEGTMEDEKFLHKKFVEYKLEGEWFQYNSFLHDYFNAHKNNSFFKKGKVFYMKMYEDETNWAIQCDHIGEVKLFMWICNKSLKNENFFYYHDLISINDFEKEYSIKPSTQHKYLKLLQQKGLLTKVKNGVYQPNPKYVEYL